jgi:hypothetical protein
MCRDLEMTNGRVTSACILYLPITVEILEKHIEAIIGLEVITQFKLTIDHNATLTIEP